MEKYYGGNSAIRLADGTKARSTHSGSGPVGSGPATPCLLYTSDAADERSSVDFGGGRIIKQKKKQL